MTNDIQTISNHKTVNNENKSQSKQQTNLINTTITLQIKKFISIYIQPLYNKSNSLLPYLLIFNTRINIFIKYKKYNK